MNDELLLTEMYCNAAKPELGCYIAPLEYSYFKDGYLAIGLTDQGALLLKFLKRHLFKEIWE